MSPARRTARRGPGRPADETDRRGAILAAARTEFAAKGYDGASIRAIAARADVDPALVHHYFGTKERVFVAAMALPFDPASELPAALSGDLEGLPERLVRLFFSVWDDPETREPLLALLRSAVTNEAAAGMMRQFVGTALLGRVAEQLPGPDARLRTEAAVSQLVGAALLRYVLEVEPLASLPLEGLVRLLVPGVRAHLDPATG
jgi:AcrR family transcriptional regulator